VRRSASGLANRSVHPGPGRGIRRGRLVHMPFAQSVVVQVEAGFADRCNTDSGFNPDGAWIVLPHLRGRENENFVMPVAGGVIQAWSIGARRVGDMASRRMGCGWSMWPRAVAAGGSTFARLRSRQGRDSAELWCRALRQAKSFGGRSADLPQLRSRVAGLDLGGEPGSVGAAQAVCRRFRHLLPIRVAVRVSSAVSGLSGGKHWGIRRACR